MAVLFLSALTVGFSGAMMPGSLLTYTIQQSLQTGARAGVLIAAGHAVLEIGIILLIFMGLGSLLQTDTAQIIISLAGGGLLTLMGIQMITGSIRNTVQIHTDGSSPRAKNFRLIVSGAVISVTNPYFLLWWAVVGLGFIMQSYGTLGPAGVLVYYLGHISADFIWYTAIAVIIGKTRRFIKESPYRLLIGVLGGLLIYFGMKFIFGITQYL